MKVKQYRKFESFLERTITKAQRKLHIARSPLLSASVDTLDMNSEVVSRIQFKSNSYVRNYFNIMAMSSSATGADGNTSTSADGSAGCLVNWSGVNRYPFSYNNSSSALNTRLAYSPTNASVRVGTSDIAESFEDYTLTGAISNGSGSGELVKSSVSIVSNLWDSTNRVIYSNISQSYTNNSGADIIVKEMGLSPYFRIYTTTSGSSQVNETILIARDVLPTAITIANGETKTFTYTIKYPF